MAKSAQDRRVYTPSTHGAVRDRRPGHSSYRTVCGVDRPHHPARPGGQRRGPGRPAVVSDAELVCLAVAQVLLRYNDEHHWLRAAPSRVGHLFPRLLSQPAYNRRLRAVADLMDAALRWLADHTPATAELLPLLDGTPVSVAARGPPPGVPTLPAGPATAATPPPLLLLGQPAAAAHHSRRDRDRVRAGQSQTAGRTPGRGGHAGWVAANRPAPGTLLVGDKGFAGCDFQTALAELELGMVRPARTDEPDVASSPTGCDSGSRRSSGPSSTSWVWTVTAAASRPGCGRGWCSACSPQRRHLVQLADRRPDQALPGRLRPPTLPLPASKTTSTI